MDKILFQLVLTFLILNQHYCQETQNKEIRNILVFIFPGGKSHNFIFKELFEYTKLRISKEKPHVEYKFDILLHNFDSEIWSSTEHSIFGYGNVEEYEEKFFRAMEQGKEDPVLGYNSFNNAMIHLYNDFFHDKTLMSRLKVKKYDLMISDISNVLTPHLVKELKINKKMFVNPTCIFTWFNDVFEYNASYHPLIGTTFTEIMSFKERFINQLFLLGTRAFYELFRKSQVQPFIDNGYPDADYNPFIRDALHICQCVDGLNYPQSLPPNIISAGAFLPKPAHKIEDEMVNEFLNQFAVNVYVSQGTITKALQIDTLLEVFESFPNVGFIVSLKEDIIVTIQHKVKKNVLLLKWVPQNDLLGDNRIKAFITHGGINSIFESAYHSKPMIVIGTSIDQVNNAIVIEYRGCGIAFTDEAKVNKVNIISAISELLSNPKYEENCKRISLLVKENDGKNKFYFWLNHAIEVGYEHLLVPAILKENWIQLYNVDIAFFWIFVLFAFYYSVKTVFRKFFKF